MNKIHVISLQKYRKQNSEEKITWKGKQILEKWKLENGKNKTFKGNISNCIKMHAIWLYKVRTKPFLYSPLLRGIRVIRIGPLSSLACHKRWINEGVGMQHNGRVLILQVEGWGFDPYTSLFAKGRTLKWGWLSQSASVEQLDFQRQRHLLSCLCDNACKRSPDTLCKEQGIVSQ